MYENSFCPVCKSRLFEDDDVVVCPVCGAPHHRGCYNHLNHCAHEAEHGTFVYSTPEPESKDIPPVAPNFSASGKEHTGHKCPQCGRMSTSDILFCPYCGYSFAGGQNNAGTSPFDMNGMGFRPFVFDPYGGVDPSETFDGVSVQDIAKFVFTNSARYISRFYNFFKKGTKASFNWAAFLIPAFWFLFRKLYKEGVLLLIISLVSTALTTPVWGAFSKAIASSTNNDPQLYMDAFTNTLKSSSVVAVSCFYAGIALTVIVSVLCGIFGDYIYARHCVRAVKQIKTEDGADEMLRAKGGVNILAPFAANIAVLLIGNIIGSGLM